MHVDSINCRICRSAEHPLICPCRCTGSIKYVHEKCLNSWIERLRRGKIASCETCGFEYLIEKVHIPGTPKVLPVFKLIKLSFQYIKSKFSFGRRVLLLFLIWCIGFPLLVSMCFSWISLSASFSGLIIELYSVIHAVETCVMSGMDCFHPSLVLPGNLFSSDFFYQWRIGVIVSISSLLSLLTLLVVFDFVNGWNTLRLLEREDNSPNTFGETATLESETGFEVELTELINSEVDVEEENVDQLEINVNLYSLIGLEGTFITVLHNLFCLVLVSFVFLCLFLYFPTMLGCFMLTTFANIVKIISENEILSSQGINFLLGIQDREIMLDNTVGNLTCTLQETTTANSFYLGCQTQDVNNSLMIRTYMDESFFYLEPMAYVIGHSGIFLLLWFLCYILKLTKLRSQIAMSLLSTLFVAINCYKVFFFITLKLVSLPFLFGSGVYISLQTAFFLEDYYFIFTSRFFISFIQIWFIGITSMVIVTSMLSHVRNILHPDILARFIRNHDPSINFMQSLVSESCVEQLKKTCSSFCLYSLIFLTLIWFPLVFTEKIADIAGCNFESIFRKHVRYYPIPQGIPENLYLSCSTENFTLSDSLLLVEVLPAVTNKEICFFCNSENSSSKQEPLVELERYHLIRLSKLVAVNGLFDYNFLSVQLPLEILALHCIAVYLLERWKVAIFHAQQILIYKLATFCGLYKYLLPRSISGSLYNEECDYIGESNDLLPRESPNNFKVKLFCFMLLYYLTFTVLFQLILLSPLYIAECFIQISDVNITHFSNTYFIGCLLLCSTLEFCANITRLNHAQIFNKMFLCVLVLFLLKFTITGSCSYIVFSNNVASTSVSDLVKFLFASNKISLCSRGLLVHVSGYYIGRLLHKFTGLSISDHLDTLYPNISCWENSTFTKLYNVAKVYFSVLSTILIPIIFCKQTYQVFFAGNHTIPYIPLQTLLIGVRFKYIFRMINGIFYSVNSCLKDYRYLIGIKILNFNGID